MDQSKHILVTGADGQLGMEFRELAAGYPQYVWHFHNRHSMPVTDKNAIQSFFSEHAIFACINCAAFTGVDQAEIDQQHAFAVNADGPENLAEASHHSGTILIHISTDYVFPGIATEPYKETDITGPANVYGASKLLGEEKLLAKCPSSILIRTSWVFSSYGKNFVKTMLRLMNERDAIHVVNDQQGCPTYAADLASAIMQILASQKSPTPGIYHFANEGITNWYAFAQEIKRISGSHCEVLPVPTSSYPTAAKRPAYSVLDTQKIRNEFGLQIPGWKESLQKCISRLSK